MFVQTPSEAFIAAAYKGTRAEYLDQHTPETLADAVCYLNNEGTAGFALIPEDGSLWLSALFNRGESGQGRAALAAAVALGANRLTCFDGFLPEYYSRNAGFYIIDRVPFDEALAPVGWDYFRNGRPDVVTMVRGE